MTAPSDQFRIEWEWEPARTVRSPEHRATWARIEIVAGGEHITLVEDGESSSSRRSIYCPLYPLAEWISYNWWLLQANSRPAIPLELLRGGASGQRITTVDAAARRHCMRSAGDGFLWPNLLIVPEGTQTLLRWTADSAQSPSRGIRYLGQGYKFIDSEIVVHVLSSLVESVIARLADQGVVDVPLIEEWETIQQADDDEIQFCLAAARLGLDPYSEAATFEEPLLRAGRELSGPLLDDFLSAVSLHLLDAGLEWVAGARDAVAEAIGRQDSLFAMRNVIRRDFDTGDRFPWRTGWRQARRVREALTLDPRARIDPGRYVTSVSRPSGDRRLQAVGGTGRNRRSPTVVVGSSASDNARRFTLSRALWHFLAEDDPVFLVTASYTDRQRIERAFAAELLAPSEGIEQYLSPGALSEDDLEEIAEHFGVSVRVVEHQVQNQLLMNAT